MSTAKRGAQSRSRKPVAPSSKNNGKTHNKQSKPQRRQGASATPKARRHSWWRGILKWGVIFTAWGSFALLCLVAWLAYDLPDLDKIYRFEKRPGVTLLAANGTVLASYGDLYGTVRKPAELPPYLIQALLATEDRRFYSHPGFDPIGLLRAVYINVSSGKLQQGGSTLTQQLAKNVFLSPARNVRRKGQELILALWIEHKFSKDEILTLYLNRVYFGAGTYGVEAAAQKFFGKPATKVNLYEAAIIAGAVKAPSRYNPLSDRAAADKRAREVLANMVEAGYLTEADAQQAIAEGARQSWTPSAAAGGSGQYYAAWVLAEVSDYIGSANSDLIIKTDFDGAIQRVAELAVSEVMNEKGGDAQAAAIVMTPDGAVRALVGGRDYRATQFDRATQARRQAGSAFKPFVFLTALEQGAAPDDVWDDAAISINGYRPANFENRYYGPVSLRTAFAKSLNSVSVQLAQRVGIANVIKTARRLGIDGKLPRDLSLALGTAEVSLLDLTGAYAVFANQGYGVLPRGIEEITTSDGTVLYRREGTGLGRLVSPRPLAQMHDLFASVIQSGTGHAADPGRPAGGKTGTSQNYQDAWFIGYTREMVAGVWVGRDDNKPMDKVTGGSLPAEIWRRIVTPSLATTPVRPLGAGAAAEAPVGPPASLLSPDQVPAATNDNNSDGDVLGDLIDQALGTQ